MEAIAEGKGPIRFLDATWFHVPKKCTRSKFTQWVINKYKKYFNKNAVEPRNATAEYETEHIKGALFWDIEKICKRPEYTNDTDVPVQVWTPHEHM